jgi:hypothetical protein
METVQVKVSEAVQLGDGTRTFGSNGMLVLITNYTDSGTNVVTESPYKSIISSDATILEVALTGTNVTSSSSSAVDSANPDIGYDGNFIDATATYMLVTAPSNPKGLRIDGTSNSDDANGVINATGDHTSWTLYDSVGYGDDDDIDAAENGEFLYGQIVYVQDHANFSDKHFITTSATIVDFATTSDANYILRQGSKTGHTADDWIVSANGSNSAVPNWIFSTSDSKVYPVEFKGWEGIKDVYGDLNPTAESFNPVTITVSIDVSADPGGVNIVTPSVSGSWAEYAATVDPNDANKYSYTFPDDVTSAEFVWKVYGTSAGDVQENLTGLVGGGAYENNIAAYLPTNNGINTDYSTYCNRTVSSSETYEAPTFIFNSFQQVGVTYTELTVTAPAGNNVVMDYSLNNWSEFHGPGAKDNGDGTHTAIVNSDLAFEYKWNDLTAGTPEDLTACANGGGINTDNSTYANRVHTAGVNASDVFNTCPSTASVDDNNVLDAQVYPNPTTGLLTISSAEAISGVEVYNVIGKRVLQVTNVVNNSVDVSSLSKGIYMLKIASGDSIATKKIIKN